jgi:hypothetical protein
MQRAGTEQGTHAPTASVMPVILPGKIVQFLEQRANVAFAGARSRDLVPLGSRVSGWRIGADGRTLIALVPEPHTAGFVESLKENGEMALTVESFPSHETYQFKGRFVRHRPVQRDDLDMVDRIRDRFLKNLRTVYSMLPESIGAAFISPPGLAVEFDVLEIYLQTPGPGAGARLVPPAEA